MRVVRRLVSATTPSGPPTPNCTQSPFCTTLSACRSKPLNRLPSVRCKPRPITNTLAPPTPSTTLRMLNCPAKCICQITVTPISSSTVRSTAFCRRTMSLPVTVMAMALMPSSTSVATASTRLTSDSVRMSGMSTSRGPSGSVITTGTLSSTPLRSRIQPSADTSRLMPSMRMSPRRRNRYLAPSTQAYRLAPHRTAASAGCRAAISLMPGFCTHRPQSATRAPEWAR